MRRGFVADIKKLRGVGREEQDARFVRDAKVRLVQNRAAELEALEVAGFAVGVGAGEYFFSGGGSEYTEAPVLGCEGDVFSSAMFIFLESIA